MKPELCPKCNHYMYLHGGDNNNNFKCWERNGDENNDFCGCTHGKPEEVSLELYVIQNSIGDYFRSKGYGGGGLSWVKDIKSAKTYTKLSQARSRVTYFNNNNPQKLPAPKIIVLTATVKDILNETDLITKIKKDKELKIINQKKNV